MCLVTAFSYIGCLSAWGGGLGFRFQLQLRLIGCCEDSDISAEMVAAHLLESKGQVENKRTRNCGSLGGSGSSVAVGGVCLFVLSVAIDFSFA